MVVFTKLDRLGRSVNGLSNLVEEFNSQGIQLVSIDQAIDTTGPYGRFFFHIFSAIAELERTLISERTKEGLETARRHGKTIGRPSLDLDPENIQIIEDLRENKHKSLRDIVQYCVENGIKTRKGKEISLYCVRKTVSKNNKEFPHKNDNKTGVRKSTDLHTSKGVVA